jgi:hypothetical protein
MYVPPSEIVGENPTKAKAAPSASERLSSRSCLAALDSRALLAPDSKALPEPEALVKVSLESYSLRRNDDKEPWQTLRPTRGRNGSVMDSDGNKDIMISLDAPLLEGTESFAVKNEKTNKAVLSVEQYLLPYQGVTMTWSPHRTEEVCQSSTHSELSSTPIPKQEGQASG